MASASKIDRSAPATRKPMLDVRRRLGLAERPQQALHGQPLFQLRHAVQHRQHARLADQEQRHAGLAVGLEIQQQPQGLEGLTPSSRWASSTAITACRPCSALAARNR